MEKYEEEYQLSFADQFIESYLHNHCQIKNNTLYLYLLDKSPVSHRPHDKVLQAKSTQIHNQEMTPS